MNRTAVLLKAASTLGPGWALTRAKLVLLNKLGVLEHRTPLYAWSDIRLDTILRSGIPAQKDEYKQWRMGNSARFFFEETCAIEGKAFIGGGSIQTADAILNGEFPFFGYVRDLGFPPEWRLNPLTREPTAGGHWSKLNEFESGDIKLTWEASRFSWVFALCRAYARSKDERYAEAFWQLLKSWLAANPPNEGIHWRCGQECSFRVMALCFGFYTFANSASSTADRVAQFLAVIGVHAKRISAYIEYAQSQNNNHGLSEGTGLWTIGLLFPELRGASGWKAHGRKVIESEIRRQVYADGGYVQHSANYHRVMLHELAWALRLGERNNDPLSLEAYKALRRATHFLHGLIAPEKGWTPNYGANDGSLVLPLSDCEYPDFRPVLQNCHFIAEKETLYPPGPWDEEMVWLNGAASLKKRLAQDKAPADLSAKAAGCYTMRSSDSWTMLRGSRYEDRPSHADQLHLDLWWRGDNVFCDAGTYSYNADAPFEDGFASSRYHNTVTVDGLDQMTRIGRFLWADWANADVSRRRNIRTEISAMQGEHDGYSRVGVIHRRLVAGVNPQTWVVVDDLIGRGKHKLRLHWLTPDVAFRVIATGIVDLKPASGDVRISMRCSAESHFDIVRAGRPAAGVGSKPAELDRGWSARYYARMAPALSLAMSSRAPVPVRFITVVELGKMHEVEIARSLDSIQINSKKIDLSTIGASPIIPDEKL